MPNTITTLQRFWSHVVKSDYCWEWSGGKTVKGYGAFWFDGKLQPAHRVSYVLHFGDFNRALLVCHHCDNPGCIRPDHLFLGTAKANTADALAKGRLWCPRLKGSDVLTAKLNEKQAREIFELYKSGLSQQAIASRFSVGRTTVGRIVRGVTWKHVTIGATANIHSTIKAITRD